MIHPLNHNPNHRSPSKAIRSFTVNLPSSIRACRTSEAVLAAQKVAARMA